MADFSIKRHDRRPSIRIQVTQKSNAQPLDLTGATATFLMKNASTGILKVSAAAVVESPNTSGFVRYDWATGDTDTAGNYNAEFELSFTGQKQSVPTTGYISIQVVEDLNNA